MRLSLGTILGIGPDGPGSWIRTPGARNPFQKMELLEPLVVGDVRNGHAAETQEQGRDQPRPVHSTIA